MKIAVDLRSLLSGTISGVENYTLNLVDQLLNLDKANQYIFFYSYWREKESLISKSNLHFVNSQTKFIRLPNKLLNFLFYAKLITLEALIGDFDCLLMPNLSQINIKNSAKLILTVHDLSFVAAPNEFYDLKRRLWHKYLNIKKIIKRANTILAVSENTKENLIKLFKTDKEKIKVIYPGLDHSVFNQNVPINLLRKTRNLYNLPGDYILFLNTIEPRKNLIGFIKAFEMLDLPVNLVIAGKQGWRYKQTFEYIKNSQKHSKIKYLGYISEEHKPALIKMSKVFVYPSFYEGFGFQVLESMALGVPVLASQVASLPEIANNAALLINPYSVNSIAAGLKEILTNEKIRNALISKGLKRAGNFYWQECGKKVLEQINLLGNKL